MDVFAGLKNFFRPSTGIIDNLAFKLHYKVTVALLIGASILVTSRQYFGDPIDCISRDDIPPRLLDTFCWIHTTFSLPQSWEKKIGDEVPYPGVDKYTPGEKRVYHAYYQWVCFVLFLQALLFYLPRYFWKVMEGGRVKNLILNLNSPILSDEAKATNRKILVDYLLRNLNYHDLYFVWLAVSELMNFINVVGQIYLVDAFLGGEFTTYGTEVLKFTNWDSAIRYDPMVKVFPRLTKCTFHRYGSSGDVQRHDAMCILPINIINEKIYIFMWFWFVMLSVVSALVIAYRVATFFSRRIRFFVTRFSAPLANPNHLETLINKVSIGDWLLFELLAKNLDSMNYKDLVNDFINNAGWNRKMNMYEEEEC
ncbi:innexin inx2 [Trichonephila clavata]|uniref:Innexin n=1 Tax=Trichonephila clavata TaxID=2740835 RepID=A0A8X6KI75_TRICU|nr:innexin inx2 [Trichonephila clavata]